MQKIILSVFVLFTFVGLTDSYGFPPGLPYPGRELNCPQVEGTELMGSAGAVYKMENGRLNAECGYFVKNTENRWSSALIVRATWVEDPKAEQFDCLWKDMQDPFRYLINKTTQAYSEVVTYDRQRYASSFDALQHIFDQVKNLALPCSEKSAMAEQRDKPVPGSPSSGSRGKVIMMRGKDVTIQLEKGQPRAAVGDVVELSFSAAGEVIPVGTWRVSALKGDGVVEAKPLAPEGEPNIDMDALVFTSTLEKSESVQTKKEPLKSDNLSTAKDLYKRLMTLSDGTDPSRMEIFERARDGDPTAQNQVGAYFYDGDGVPQSYEEAAKWYRLAAEHNEPWAMSNLAWLYEHGYGVDQDLDQAVSWSRRGADQGFANGQRYLGYMYQRGMGVPRDYTEAVRLYRLSAAQNYGPAHNDLGIMYQQGWGVQQDHAQAVIWFRSAANLENDLGYKNLAMHYEKGLGVPANRDLAIQNYKAAARLGNSKAQDWLHSQGMDW